jgi:hypothetical protein
MKKSRRKIAVTKMMKIEDCNVAVIDTGLFVQFARTMAARAKSVIYYNPEVRAFPSIHQSCIGDGFDNIEVVRSFWPYLDDIQLFCYPDCGRGDEQMYLRSIGKPVWGSGHGEALELKREWFLEVLKEVGLEVPEYHVCEGLNNLRQYLSDKEDQYVKISRYRGDLETSHWINGRMGAGWLDSLAVRFGPLQHALHFLVFPAIPATVEVGGDTYNIDGQWPATLLNGIESKDKSYFAAVTARDKMPRQVQAVMEAFGPVLKHLGYRGQWSSEIRVTDDSFFFLDATCRGGMPSSGSQQMLWNNFADIVLAGAQGELIEPEPAGKFSIETMITSADAHDDWDTVEIPEELEGIAQFSNCCYVDGAYAFPPCEHGGKDLGWLVSIGNTPSEVLQKQKDAADLLPDGLSADCESLASVIKSIDEAEKVGVGFTQQEMPEPAEAL